MVPNTRWRYAAFQWVNMASFPVDLLRPIRNHRSQAAGLHLRGRPKHCMLTPAFPNVFVLGTDPRTDVVEHAHVLSS